MFLDQVVCGMESWGEWVYSVVSRHYNVPISLSSHKLPLEKCIESRDEQPTPSSSSQSKDSVSLSSLPVVAAAVLADGGWAAATLGSAGTVEDDDDETAGGSSRDHGEGSLYGEGSVDPQEDAGKLRASAPVL